MGLVLTSYYVLLALVIIASIRTVGTVLVTALLVIPAAIAGVILRPVVTLTKLYHATQSTTHAL